MNSNFKNSSTKSEFENLVTDYINKCGFSQEEAENAAINTLETEVILC